MTDSPANDSLDENASNSNKQDNVSDADLLDPVVQEMQLVAGISPTEEEDDDDDELAGERTQRESRLASVERRRRAAAIGRRRRRMCIVPQCYSSEASQPPVHLHSFPQSAAISELWKRSVSNPKLSTVASKLLAERQYVVCSLHFEDACYENPASRDQPETARLKWNAVPTVGLNSREPHPTGGAPLCALVQPGPSSTAAPAAAAAAADNSFASDSSDINDGNLVIVKPENPACDDSSDTLDAPEIPTERSTDTQPQQQQQPQQKSRHLASSSKPSATIAIEEGSPAKKATAGQPPASTAASAAAAAPASAPVDNSHEFTLLNRIVRVALGMDQAQSAMLRELCGLKRRQHRQHEVLGHLCRQLTKSVEEAPVSDGTPLDGKVVDLGGRAPQSPGAGSSSKRIRLQLDGDSEAG